MTEDEAKKRWCPFSMTFGHGVSLNRINFDAAQSPDVRKQTRCLGSGCMAWRWEIADTADGRGIEMSKTYGYCGLAGRP